MLNKQCNIILWTIAEPVILSLLMFTSSKQIMLLCFVAFFAIRTCYIIMLSPMLCNFRIPKYSPPMSSLFVNKLCIGIIIYYCAALDTSVSNYKYKASYKDVSSSARDRACYALVT